MRTRKQFAFVSFLLALIAAGSGLFVWNLPTRGAGPESGKRPRALLQIASHPPRVMVSNVDGLDDYKRFFETQCIVIRSNLVLNAALRPPEVSKLPSIRQRTDPIAWLQQNLEAIRLKDSEVLQVSLAATSGASTADQAAIINAVVKAYMDEVVDVYTKRRVVRHDQLKKLKRQYEEMLKERRDNLRKLSQTVASDQLTSQEKEVLPRLYHDLRTQRVKLLLERAEAEALLARRKKAEGARSEPVRKEIAQIEDRLAVLIARQKVLDEELSRVKLEMREVTDQQLDLEALKDDVTLMQESARKVGAEVEALTIELQAPPRIRVLDEAIPPR
ncbi:MAG: hypothetical protein ACHRXM_09625 [Isosphaerales bacterium]